MLPMSVCVALSQGYIGYDLQNALREELLSRGINKPVATLVTQVEVDANDPAFLNPTKPIGSFFTEQEAEQLTKQGYTLKKMLVAAIAVLLPRQNRLISLKKKRLKLW